MPMTDCRHVEVPSRRYSVSVTTEIVDRGAGYESTRREGVSVWYSTSRLGNCGIRDVLM